ncbi:hypothetical protein AB1L30_00070, partial [Bremerella sp. JC817]|uniref:hypothetical protein n=1 Tax=Bremerella sp. JC817 TaxID=3231756 RepID=UPI0034580A2C
VLSTSRPALNSISFPLIIGAGSATHTNKAQAIGHLRWRDWRSGLVRISTRTKDICYTVCKPVWETKTKEICYTAHFFADARAVLLEVLDEERSKLRG